MSNKVRPAMNRYMGVTWLLIGGFLLYSMLKPMDLLDGLRQRRAVFLTWLDQIFQSERKRVCDQILFVLRRDIDEIVKDMDPDAEEDMREYLKDLEALASEGYYRRVFVQLFPSLKLDSH